VLGDAIAIDRDGERITRRTVAGLARFVATACDLKLGWGQFPDEAEVIYLYDKGDAYFGYALNLACEWSSEWGYAPFGGSGADCAEFDRRPGRCEDAAPA
jgi:hypothetical protein